MPNTRLFTVTDGTQGHSTKKGDGVVQRTGRTRGVLSAKRSITQARMETMYPSKKPKQRSLSTKERAFLARDHWERNHGDDKELYESCLE